MRVVALVENKALSPMFRGTHGLCYYIEWQGRKMLFDLGSNHLFINHAIEKGIRIAEIDTVIISHGHRDHGGGLKQFFSQNRTAKVYIRSSAFQPLFVMRDGTPRFVGLDAAYQNHPQVVLVDEDFLIDESSFLFTRVDGCQYLSHSNCVLFQKKSGEYVQDMFHHEQNLVISFGDKQVLFCGCAHNGIVNIQNRGEALLGKPMTHVIGGFHLYNSFAGTSESRELVEEIGQNLLARDTWYYTGHCTGTEAYHILKAMLGKRISYFYVGEEIHIL